MLVPLSFSFLIVPGVLLLLSNHRPLVYPVAIAR
jgi:hypothetical protein